MTNSQLEARPLANRRRPMNNAHVRADATAIGIARRLTENLTS